MSQNSSTKTKSCSLKLLLISLSAGCTYAVCTRGAGVSLSQKGKEATQTAKSKLTESTRGTLMCFFFKEFVFLSFFLKQVKKKEQCVCCFR